MGRDEPKPQPRKPTRRVSACPDDRRLLRLAASARNGYKFARLRGGIAHALDHFNLDSLIFFLHNNVTTLVKVFVLANIA
jgi:hypothetical protein